MKLRKHLNKYLLAWLSILLPILTSFIIYYLAYAEPDIRMPQVNKVDLQFIDVKEDENNNAIIYMKIKLPFKNYSMKAGHIDKVEFVPESIDVIPEIKVTHINKEPIYWRSQKDIEVMFLVNEKVEAILQKKIIAVRLMAYDNVGKPCLNEDGTPSYFIIELGRTEAVFEKSGRPNFPVLEMHISRLSIYEECLPISSGVGSRFAPWIGVELDIANLGNQPAILKNFEVISKYKPLNQLARSNSWYITDTRTPNSSNLFGSQEQFSVEPASNFKTHITFPLMIGETALTEAEKDSFLDLLEKTGKLNNILGETYIKAWDVEGHEYDSYEFFSQGKELMFRPKGIRSRMSTTYLKEGTNNLTIVDRDFVRDGNINVYPMTPNNSFNPTPR